MKTILALGLFLLSIGCPYTDPCFGDDCDVIYTSKTYGLDMKVTVQPGAQKTTAEVDVEINRPTVSYRGRRSTTEKRVSDHSPSPSTKGKRPVKEGEDAYEEEVTLKLHWSCPTLDKSGEVDVVVAENSATGKVKISDLPPHPPLTVYPWEFKRGLECILMTEDEKIAQEEQADNSADDDDKNDEETKEQVAYRGEQAFFIKQSAPNVKLSKIQVVAGSPDSYADIKVELLRNEVAVVAGDRSFDLEVEVKLPWSCSGVSTPPIDPHIIIPVEASSGQARLIMPAQQEVKLECEVDAKAHIDSYIIGRSDKELKFDIPPKQ